MFHGCSRLQLVLLENLWTLKYSLNILLILFIYFLLYWEFSLLFDRALQTPIHSSISCLSPCYGAYLSSEKLSFSTADLSQMEQWHTFSRFCHPSSHSARFLGRQGRLKCSLREINSRERWLLHGLVSADHSGDTFLVVQVSSLETAAFETKAAILSSS